MASLRAGWPTAIYAYGLVKAGRFRTSGSLVPFGAKYWILTRSLKSNMRAAFMHCAEGVIAADLLLNACRAGQPRKALSRSIEITTSEEI